MPKRIITLEVDSDAFFDMAAKVGDFTHIGQRLATPFLTGGLPPWSDAMGLACYGIVVTKVEPATPSTDDRAGSSTGASDA